MPLLPVSSPTWTILIPVKQTTLAKSRLTGFDAATRQRLAVAFAKDVVSAAAACPDVNRVVVVTNDPVGALLADLGAEVLPDRPDAGLNPALAYAAEHVRGGNVEVSVAALSSDLPAVRREDLSAALTSTTAGRWFVSDLASVGTTMLAAVGGHVWSPHFGPHSRDVHRALGMYELQDPDLARIRQDVDTAADLSDAFERGTGRWTSEVMASLDMRRGA